jgi:hypothetical protein
MAAVEGWRWQFGGDWPLFKAMSPFQIVNNKQDYYIR